MGEAWPHGDAARLMRTVKEAEVQGSESVDEAEVVRPGGRFLHEVDRHTRSPSALGDLSPAACEEQWHQAHVQTLDAHEEHLQSGPVLGVHFIGFCLSLSEPPIPNPNDYPEEDREFNRYTLLGEHDTLFVALLKQRCHQDGVDLSRLADYFRAHMNRGIVLLQRRVKSISDIAELVPYPGVVRT